MSRLFAAIYDHFTRPAEEACLRHWRAELLGGLSGRVLEVGAGTGMNVPYYPRTLEQLVLSEPDPHMRRHLARRIRVNDWPRAELLNESLEALAIADHAFDVVVATLVLCSVPHLDRALGEIHRVLKPGGRFVFLEHVAAEDRPRRLKWQHRIEPVWKRVAGNCHLTRNTEDAIRAAGFTVERIERESMRKAVSFVRPTIRGYAVRT
ncbi:MAG: class I SAM-dependent methyltransferase [Gemmatimonadetes bacterium]|nr:class I SAM-dependent methyltransferase [Gemmatimonadota bacterium]